MVHRREKYLEAKALTAAPHQLHLMLIEGAVRFGRRAEEAMRRGDSVAATEPLVRMLDIVGEMLAGVRGNKSKLNQQIADFYVYLFRTVSEAKVNDDAAKLADVLRLLEFERETWQLACDKLASYSPAKPPRPLAVPLGGAQAAASSNFSLEA